MIGLNIKIFDVRIFVAKSLILREVDVKRDNIYTKIALIRLGMMVP